MTLDELLMAERAGEVCLNPGYSESDQGDPNILGAIKITLEISDPRFRMAVKRQADAQGRDGLWEVRSTLPRGIARVIFTISSDEMIVLNGFIKKSQKTPDYELDLASKRKRMYERNKKSTQRKQPKRSS